MKLTKRVLSIVIAFALIFVGITFTGCNKEDENPQNPSSSPATNSNKEVVVSDHKDLTIEFTSNLEFFVGEDYVDNKLKGFATVKATNERIEVTDVMTVDKSQININQVGTYKVICEFDNLRVAYDVKYVAEMTSQECINERIASIAKSNLYYKARRIVKYYEYGGKSYAEVSVLNYLNNACTKFEIYQKRVEFNSLQDAKDSGDITVQTFKTSIEVWYYSETQSYSKLERQDGAILVGIENVIKTYQEFYQEVYINSQNQKSLFEIIPTQYEDLINKDTVFNGMLIKVGSNYSFTDSQNRYTMSLGNNLLKQFCGASYFFPMPSTNVFNTYSESCGS